MHSPDLASTTTYADVGEDGVKYHANYRNQHGTGFDMVVSNPLHGNVDLEIFQVVCNEVPEAPSVSLTLPVNAAHNFLMALQAGLQVAYHEAKLKKYH
jgi:hypothetical protein